MNSVNVYSIAYNRPDFLKLQLESVRKYIRIPENYILNLWFMINTKDLSLKENLANECKAIGASFIIVPHFENELYNGGLTAYNYIRNNFFKTSRSNDYSIIMDSDMFFYNYFNVDEKMRNYDVAAIYHQREKKILGFTKYNYEYLWVGLLIFSHKKFLWNKLKFEPIKNICDVGGMTYFFIKDNIKKGLKINWLNHTPDITYEYKEIVPENLHSVYNETMAFQIIEDVIIHYYRGSNWDGNKKKFLEKKNRFLTEFLKVFSGQSLNIKQSKYYDSMAYSRKHFNGQLNYNNLNIKINLKSEI